MDKLSDMPNVGPVLENDLLKAGIKMPEQLKKCGSMKAFTKI